MCTSLSFNTGTHYFGRNLDVEHSYDESIVITPRHYPFHFKKYPVISSHYAIIGMAAVIDDYPLYFDATNETGLSIAGLNFSGNAHYTSFKDNRDNITPYELIPWLLSTCSNISEVKQKLSFFNPLDIPFSDVLPLTPLHWHIADSTCSITLECTKDGVNYYDNATGVLTNNPPFPIQLFNLNNYMHLSVRSPKNTFESSPDDVSRDDVSRDDVSLNDISYDNVSPNDISYDNVSPDKIGLSTYSRGMGAIGLPGDYSSMSRFVKASFLRAHMSKVCEFATNPTNKFSFMSKKEPTNFSEVLSISQFFHILSSVSQPLGCVLLDNGDYEYTLYSSCCNTLTGTYYYTTYTNRSITAIHMHNEDLNSRNLIIHPLNYTSLL